MRFSLHENWRRIRSKLLRPFQRLGNKAKAAAQRFVIKTVDKNGGMNSSMGGAANGLSTGLVLSLLNARRPNEGVQLPSFQAVAVQDFLLTFHPRADFFFHRPLDLASTPWILSGNFEESVSAWICSNVASNDRVLMIGAGEGYHALSVAKQIESAGQLHIVTLPSEEQDVLDLNFRTNRLETPGKSVLSESEDFEDISRGIVEIIQRFNPSKILITPSEFEAFDMPELSSFPGAEVFAIENGEVTARTSNGKSDRSSMCRKVA